MRKVYGVRPRTTVLTRMGTFFENDQGDEAYVNHTCEIHEPEYEPFSTGILDEQGNDIIRIIEPNPIGFGHIYDE